MAHETIVEQIVDLIRQEDRRRGLGFAITTADAIDLIQHYAATMAAEAVVVATGKAFDTALETISRPVHTNMARGG